MLQRIRYHWFYFLSIICLTIFFFSYVLIESPGGEVSSEGFYYGRYIWPVGVFMERSFGSVGWDFFGFGMPVWFVYAQPVFKVMSLLGFAIPFSPTPWVGTVPTLSFIGWVILIMFVLIYNIFLATVTAPVMAVVSSILRGTIWGVVTGTRHMDLTEPDEQDKVKQQKRLGW